MKMPDIEFELDTTAIDAALSKAIQKIEELRQSFKELNEACRKINVNLLGER